MQLKALFAYAFEAKPPFCITKTTPEFHAPVPHASSSEAFDGLIPRRSDPGKHREGVQTPFSLVKVRRRAALGLHAQALGLLTITEHVDAIQGFTTSEVWWQVYNRPVPQGRLPCHDD